MEAEHKIRFAVVGCGHIGKRHIAIILQHPSAVLAAVADTDEAALAAAPAGIRRFHSLEALLKSEIAAAIEVVCIATPNGVHAALALEALDAKKHVLLEKPMTLTRFDAEQVIYKSLNVHRHVFVVKQNRYSPPIAWLKEVVNNGTLGSIFMVQVNCYWNRDERYYVPGSWHGTAHLDGGTLFTQFSHFIDIMFWIFGDIKNIHTRLHNFRKMAGVQFEDCGISQFNFVNGGMGTIQFSTAVWDKNMESSIAVIGSAGSVKISGQYMNRIEYCHIRHYTPPVLAETSESNQYTGYEGSAANHKQVFDNVADVIKNNGSITANALEGMKVVDMIERIYQAARQDG